VYAVCVAKNRGFHQSHRQFLPMFAAVPADQQEKIPDGKIFLLNPANCP
jgi:hypothetical protein